MGDKKIPATSDKLKIKLRRQSVSPVEEERVETEIGTSEDVLKHPDQNVPLKLDDIQSQFSGQEEEEKLKHSANQRELSSQNHDTPRPSSDTPKGKYKQKDKNIPLTSEPKDNIEPIAGPSSALPEEGFKYLDSQRELSSQKYDIEPIACPSSAPPKGKYKMKVKNIHLNRPNDNIKPIARPSSAPEEGFKYLANQRTARPSSAPPKGKYKMKVKNIQLTSEPNDNIQPIAPPSSAPPQEGLKRLDSQTDLFSQNCDTARPSSAPPKGKYKQKVKNMQLTSEPNDNIEPIAGPSSAPPEEGYKQVSAHVQKTSDLNDIEPIAGPSSAPPEEGYRRLTGIIPISSDTEEDEFGIFSSFAASKTDRSDSMIQLYSEKDNQSVKSNSDKVEVVSISSSITSEHGNSQSENLIELSSSTENDTQSEPLKMSRGSDYDDRRFSSGLNSATSEQRESHPDVDIIEISSDSGNDNKSTRSDSEDVQIISAPSSPPSEHGSNHSDNLTELSNGTENNNQSERSDSDDVQIISAPSSPPSKQGSDHSDNSTELSNGTGNDNQLEPSNMSGTNDYDNIDIIPDPNAATSEQGQSDNLIDITSENDCTQDVGGPTDDVSPRQQNLHVTFSEVMEEAAPVENNNDGVEYPIARFRLKKRSEKSEHVTDADKISSFVPGIGEVPELEDRRRPTKQPSNPQEILVVEQDDNTNEIQEEFLPDDVAVFANVAEVEEVVVWNDQVLGEAELTVVDALVELQNQPTVELEDLHHTVSERRSEGEEQPAKEEEPIEDREPHAQQTDAEMVCEVNVSPLIISTSGTSIDTRLLIQDSEHSSPVPAAAIAVITPLPDENNPPLTPIQKERKKLEQEAMQDHSYNINIHQYKSAPREGYLPLLIVQDINNPTAMIVEPDNATVVESDLDNAMDVESDDSEPVVQPADAAPDQPETEEDLV